jgi:hypothetical protein
VVSLLFFVVCCCEGGIKMKEEKFRERDGREMVFFIIYRWRVVMTPHWVKGRGFLFFFISRYYFKRKGVRRDIYKHRR